MSMSELLIYGLLFGPIVLLFGIVTIGSAYQGIAEYIQQRSEPKEPSRAVEITIFLILLLPAILYVFNMLGVPLWALLLIH